MTAEEIASKLGLPLERGRRREIEELAGPVEASIEFFKVGDPKHTRLTLDGCEFPLGEPVEKFRERLGGDHGFFRDPWGKDHRVTIPSSVRDGEGFYVSLSFTAYEQHRQTRR